MKINKRFIIVALIAGLIYYFVADYEYKMARISSSQLFAPAVKVKEKIMNIPRVGGHYLNWTATVRRKNGRLLSVIVAYRPIPKVGDCMPVTVTEFERGGMIAILLVDAWQTGGYSAGENHCSEDKKILGSV